MGARTLAVDIALGQYVWVKLSAGDEWQGAYVVGIEESNRPTNSQAEVMLFSWPRRYRKVHMRASRIEPMTASEVLGMRGED